LRTEVQRVQIPAKTARGRVSSRASQISPPAALLNSLNDVNGTAAALDAQPPLPVLAVDVPDIGGAAVGLQAPTS
jgi:hypothetical protein